MEVVKFGISSNPEVMKSYLALLRRGGINLMTDRDHEMAFFDEYTSQVAPDSSRALHRLEAFYLDREEVELNVHEGELQLGIVPIRNRRLPEAFTLDMLEATQPNDKWQVQAELIGDRPTMPVLKNPEELRLKGIKSLRDRLIVKVMMASQATRDMRPVPKGSRLALA